MSLSRRSVALAVAFALVANDAAADPPAVTVCADAYEEAQSLRDEGRFLEAKQRLLVCGNASCPAVLRVDCVNWLDVLVTRTPKLVITVSDTRGSRPDARVTIDDVDVDDATRGRAIPVDPGAHRVRVEAPNSLPVLREVIATEGVDQTVAVTLAPATPAERSNVVARRPMALIWTLGAVGALGLASFGYFASTGWSAEQELDRCAASCGDQRSNVLTHYVVADVSLLAALASGGLALWLFLHSSSTTMGAHAGGR